MYAAHVIESMGLQVDWPIVWDSDNKGALDILNSWTLTGRTRHIATKITFMRELKEEGRLAGRWCPKENMSSDIFTKNVGGAHYVKHQKDFVG